MKSLFHNYYPFEYAESVFNIDFRKLWKKGFRGLIFDIDNTLVHHGDNSNDRVDELFRELHTIGFRTVLLTNNDEERVLRFIRNIDTDYVCDADKPSTDGYIRAVKIMGTDRKHTLCFGDQIFTDILGANKAGIPNVLVKYIELPGRHPIGKKRYIEKVLLFLRRHNKRYRNRLGNIFR